GGRCLFLDPVRGLPISERDIQHDIAPSVYLCEEGSRFKTPTDHIVCPLAKSPETSSSATVVIVGRLIGPDKRCGSGHCIDTVLDATGSQARIPTLVVVERNATIRLKAGVVLGMKGALGVTRNCEDSGPVCGDRVSSHLPDD